MMLKHKRKIDRVSNCEDCGSHMYYDFSIDRYLHPEPLCWLAVNSGAGIHISVAQQQQLKKEKKYETANR